MAHHPYNTHMLRHVEAWSKPGVGPGSVVEMMAGSSPSGTAVSMGSPVASNSSPSSSGTSVQWPSAASELCEVVITECLRQQQQLAQHHQVASVVAAAQQQAAGSSAAAAAASSSSSSSSSASIVHDHVVSPMSAAHMAIDDVLPEDMSLHSHPLQHPLSIPVHVVTSATSRSRRCSHQPQQRHHHHHPQGGSGAQQHHHLTNQDKLIAMGYNVSPYPCRYRLPSSDLLPNHEELVAAGAIPSSSSSSQPMLLSSPHVSPATPPRKPRKPRAARGSRGGRGVRKQPPPPVGLLVVDGENPVSAPVTSTSTFPCPECGKKFLWASRLVVHRRSHTGEKPFVCPQCGAAFAQRWILAVHLRTHSPPEPPPPHSQQQQQQQQQLDGSPESVMDMSLSQLPLNLGVQGQQVEI